MINYDVILFSHDDEDGGIFHCGINRVGKGQYCYFLPDDVNWVNFWDFESLKDFFMDMIDDVMPNYLPTNEEIEEGCGTFTININEEWTLAEPTDDPEFSLEIYRKDLTVDEPGYESINITPDDCGYMVNFGGEENCFTLKTKVEMFIFTEAMKRFFERVENAKEIPSP